MTSAVPVSNPVYFVERLTLKVIVASVWPRLLTDRLRGRHKTAVCYVIDGSTLAMALFRLLASMAGISAKRFVYQLTDVRDDDGLQIRWRVQYQDLTHVQQRAALLPELKGMSEAGFQPDPTFYLGKQIAYINVNDPSSTYRALIVVQVCAWKAKQDSPDSGGPAVLFMERRPWDAAIHEYASSEGVHVIPLQPSTFLRTALRRSISPRLLTTLRYLRHRPVREILSFRRYRPAGPVSVSAERTPKAEIRDVLGQGSNPLVAVDYTGNLNLDLPHKNSDLFFWQTSSLKGSEVLLAFSRPDDPLDAGKAAELESHGINTVVTHPGGTTIKGMPVFTHHQTARPALPEALPSSRKSLEMPWLRRQIATYRASRDYWSHLFEATGVKVYTSWYKYGPDHCAIMDAVRSVGGIGTIYQRSYEPHPSAETAVDSDILFGFSPAAAEIERRSGSRVPYHVTTGYVGDSRFSYLTAKSRTMREDLKRCGAERVLAYFDENSMDDPRWFPGNEDVRRDYAFLLNKLQEEPWLGLLIKPKAPRSLRGRLGPVLEMLERAEATGRCYVYEDDAYKGSDPPAAAGLAADIAIHSDLVAATAGIEAALAGVTTILLDLDGWRVSPLYQLGVGRVVFTDWDSLWEACREHWRSPGGIPGFGDWSPMLEVLDPFRDGRASERIGDYIQDLLAGFRRGRDRETIMAEAAERYCTNWGADKIISIDGRSQAPSAWVLPGRFHENASDRFFEESRP